MWRPGEELGANFVISEEQNAKGTREAEQGGGGGGVQSGNMVICSSPPPSEESLR